MSGGFGVVSTQCCFFLLVSSVRVNHVLGSLESRAYRDRVVWHRQSVQYLSRPGKGPAFPYLRSSGAPFPKVPSDFLCAG